MDSSVSTSRTAGAHVAVGTVYLGHRKVVVHRIEPRTPEASSRPLLWLHGWGLSPAPYLAGLTAFADRAGRSVIAPALPGFGGSDPLPLRSQGISGVAAHVAAALEQCGLTEASLDVAGHSFGGGVALRLAATRPDLATALTLFCPAGGSGLGAVPLHRLLAAATRDGGHSWAPAAVASVGSHLRHHPAAVLGSALAAWRADLLHDLCMISRHKIPTRLSFAADDGILKPGPLGLASLPGVFRETVPGRHSWMLGEPQRFAECLRAHVDAAQAMASTRKPAA